MRKHFSLFLFIILLSLPALFHISNLVKEKGYLVTGFYVAFSVFLLVLPLVFIRPRIFGFFLFPFLALMPLELIHVSHYDGYSTLAALVSTLETNPHEVVEFQQNYRHYFYILFPLILLSIILFFKYVKPDYKLPVSVRTGILVTFLAILTTFTARNMYEFYTKDYDDIGRILGGLYSRLIQQSFPYSYFAKGYGYVKQRRIVADSLEAKKSFTFNARAESQDIKENKPVVVLVIGETSRAYSWQLGGYHRETNPGLIKRENLLYYKDAISAAAHTSQTIQLVMSRATPGNLEPIYNEKSIITAFREAGYKTIWISNQNMTGGVETKVYPIAMEADRRLFVGADYQTNPEFDDVLIPMIDRVLKQYQSDPLLLVVHTMGSHEVYRNRYPPEFELFKPASHGDDYNFSSPDIRERILNSYDNSILYTDYVLDLIIDSVENSRRLSTLLYFSDHGENILDDGTARFGHGGVIPTRYVSEIPMFIWVSEKFQARYPEKYKSLRSNLHKPVSNLYIFDTLLDIGGIYIDGMPKTYSLANADLETTDRYILNSDYKPVNYSRVIEASNNGARADQ